MKATRPAMGVERHRVKHAGALSRRIEALPSCANNAKAAVR